MALRIHRVPASRWHQLAKTRLPIDLTEAPQAASRDHSRRLRAEHAMIQRYVDALARQSSNSR